MAQLMNINLYEIIDAIKMRPTHSNMMYPNIGVGGYCLTKDPFLAQWALEHIYKSSHQLDFSLSGVFANKLMPQQSFELMNDNLQGSNLSIGLLGVAYGPDITDTRHTPVFELSEMLERKHNVHYQDPFVKFWTEKSVEIEQDLVCFLEQSFDVIVFSTCHSVYTKSEDVINAYLNKNDQCQIYDLVGIIDRLKLRIDAGKDRIFILGNGHFNKS